MKNLFQLRRRINKFFSFSFNERVLLFEALLLTGLIRFAILFIPFKKLARLAGKYKEESSEQISDIEKIMVKKISWAVSIVSRRTPWQSKCLVKALTAQVMLTRRKISSTLYLGVAKDEKNKLMAHAWLRSGIEIITGNDERGMFTQVAKFANNAGGKSV